MKHNRFVTGLKKAACLLMTAILALSPVCPVLADGGIMICESPTGTVLPEEAGRFILKKSYISDVADGQALFYGWISIPDGFGNNIQVSMITENGQQSAEAAYHGSDRG